MHNSCGSMESQVAENLSCQHTSSTTYNDSKQDLLFVISSVAGCLRSKTTPGSCFRESSTNCSYSDPTLLNTPWSVRRPSKISRISQGFFGRRFSSQSKIHEVARSSLLLMALTNANQNRH